jgi:hypothetical protein
MEKIKPGMANWINSEQGKDILVILIVILVGLGSFELGRLSLADKSSGVKIEYNGVSNQANVLTALESSKILATPISQKSSTTKNFFASSKGTKYYTVGCSGGKTIKQENRVYFDTREEVEKAGYVLSSSCK